MGGYSSFEMLDCRKDRCKGLGVYQEQHRHRQVVCEKRNRVRMRLAIDLPRAGLLPKPACGCPRIEQPETSQFRTNKIVIFCEPVTESDCWFGSDGTWHALKQPGAKYLGDSTLSQLSTLPGRREVVGSLSI